jgi:muramidase (phage lysozyme)
MSKLAAFLAMLRHSEGTDKAEDPYAVTFGNAFTIQDFSDHPHALGWPGYLWKGIHETASGAYQITYPTWLRLKAKLGLNDFSPASQDAAATELLRECGALDLINGGQVADAIGLCHGIWASLPGSTSGQPQAKMADLINFYSSNGGIAA